jgi:alkaline phosphatase D
LSIRAAGPVADKTGTLVAGPMLGYQTHREVLIWVETKDAWQVTLSYWLAGKPDTVRRVVKNQPWESPAGGQPMKFVLPLLEMDARYEYSLMLDGQKLAFPYPLTFQTRKLWEWRSPPPDFKFIYGSCAYFNEPVYDRPGKPYGNGTAIFQHMADSGADFMIWGGDNWYLREVDYSSESGIWYRYQHDRAQPDVQRLYAAMPHYATWDDHDYGSNDANKSYEFKDITLSAFKSYWGNTSWGEPDNPGVYGKYYWSDAAFFLMDNRYYRDDDELDPKFAPGPIKTQYGARQRDWLKQSLVHAQKEKHAAFKFIVTGGQVITDFGGASETFAYYTAEREDLLKFIKEQGITGVIFLSGDVHFTELAREKIGDTQWVYELTSSPFSSGASKLGHGERAHDPHRVDDTAVDDQNYCTLAIHGPKDERVVTIACIDKQGVTRWTHDIKAGELK